MMARRCSALRVAKNRNTVQITERQLATRGRSKVIGCTIASTNLATELGFSAKSSAVAAHRDLRAIRCPTSLRHEYRSGSLYLFSGFCAVAALVPKLFQKRIQLCRIGALHDIRQ
jgi:hypothetical protein